MVSQLARGIAARVESLRAESGAQIGERGVRRRGGQARMGLVDFLFGGGQNKQTGGSRFEGLRAYSGLRMEVLDRDGTLLFKGLFYIQGRGGELRVVRGSDAGMRNLLSARMEARRAQAAAAFTAPDAETEWESESIQPPETEIPEGGLAQPETGESAPDTAVQSPPPKQADWAAMLADWQDPPLSVTLRGYSPEEQQAVHFTAEIEPVTEILWQVRHLVLETRSNDRAFFRQKIHEDCLIQRLDPEPGEFVSGIVHDISGGGLCVQTSVELDVGEAVLVRTGIAEYAQTLDLPCIVRRTIPPAPGRPGFSRDRNLYGCEFRDLDKATEELLMKIVTEMQMEQRRRELGIR